jgi:hypothetical protein
MGAWQQIGAVSQATASHALQLTLYTGTLQLSYLIPFLKQKLPGNNHQPSQLPTLSMPAPSSAFTSPPCALTLSCSMLLSHQACHLTGAPHY